MNVSNRPDIQQLLVNMRDMRSQVQVPEVNHVALDVKDTVTQVNQAQAPAFNELFAQAIDSVNTLQHQAGALSNAYAMGDESVDIADVMIASEKAKVGFQATVQVRNKVVEAYQEIMNMAI